MREFKAFPSRMTGTTEWRNQILKLGEGAWDWNLQTYQYSGYIQLMEIHTALAIAMKTMNTFRVHRNLFFPTARTTASSSIEYLDFLLFTSTQLDLCRVPGIWSADWFEWFSVFSLDPDSDESDCSVRKESLNFSDSVAGSASGFVWILDIDRLSGLLKLMLDLAVCDDVLSMISFELLDEDDCFFLQARGNSRWAGVSISWAETHGSLLIGSSNGEVGCSHLAGRSVPFPESAAELFSSQDCCSLVCWWVGLGLCGRLLFGKTKFGFEERDCVLWQKVRRLRKADEHITYCSWDLLLRLWPGDHRTNVPDPRIISRPSEEESDEVLFLGLCLFSDCDLNPRGWFSRKLASLKGSPVMDDRVVLLRFILWNNTCVRWYRWRTEKVHDGSRRMKDGLIKICLSRINNFANAPRLSELSIPRK